VIQFKRLTQAPREYTAFIEEVAQKYEWLMENCAKKISKYFTEMTSVINEGNQYEFPSSDIHKAIISKLILNDKLLKSVFL